MLKKILVCATLFIFLLSQISPGHAVYITPPPQTEPPRYTEEITYKEYTTTYVIPEKKIKYFEYKGSMYLIDKHKELERGGCACLFPAEWKFYESKATEGEGLREFIKDYPESLSYLDKYQENISRDRSYRDWGLFFLGLAVIVPFLNPKEFEGVHVYNLLDGWPLIVVGVIILGVGGLQHDPNNELNLLNTANKFNDKSPDKIKLFLE